MFAMLKMFPKDNAIAKAAKVAVRWGTGVVITALGFQTIYAVLMTEFEWL